MGTARMFAYELESLRGQRPFTLCRVCGEAIIDLDCYWVPASNRRFWVHKRCVREDAQFVISHAEAFKDWQERAGVTYEVYLHNGTLEDSACLKAGLRCAEGALIEAAHLDLEPEIRSRDKLLVALLDPMNHIADAIHFRLIARGTWRRLHSLAFPDHALGTDTSS